MGDRACGTVTFRQIRLPDDVPRVKEIFAAGMRFYLDRYDEEDSIRTDWEKYVQHSIETDLSNIEDVYLKGGGFWVLSRLWAWSAPRGSPTTLWSSGA
mmetsp:Transcript_2545/g.5970  ORF Transcript_2545/g.5970 Transcript_2545/m.5970 type:complete len:98 (+) Transcript_2545:127-420(+)